MYKFITLLVLVTFVVAVGAASEKVEFKDTFFTSAWTRLLQNSIHTKRFLRAHKSVSDDEERAVSTSTVESLVKSTVSTEQLQAWLKRGDSTDFVFKALKLQKAGDNLLDSPHLTAWISYMKLFNKENPTKKASLIATLTAHYGDQGLAKIIEAGKQVKTSAKNS
ncbi:Secreted RxLR effector peptide protein [Phytophthora palmivora]|uniref:RxLR effector protein n=1 Tax=Phytophthora palmivora TaxID=4796 RepID=A0A2P4YLV1_9STRA|nr:Secreted RxLR effector peptide protein [Phytophthora palmivora]